MTRRVPIVPYAVSVPPTDEALKVLETRRIERGLGPLLHERKQRYRKRLDARVARLLRAFPTVRDLTAEKREPIRQLAVAGARIHGPVTQDEVDHLAADLHAEAPWMCEVSNFIMMHLRANVSAGGDRADPSACSAGGRPRLRQKPVRAPRRRDCGCSIAPD